MAMNMALEMEDEGTRLKQEMALSEGCDCDFCKEYRKKHGAGKQ
jgi:hypothetical protein